jgi:hypothetical protein
MGAVPLHSTLRDSIACVEAVVVLNKNQKRTDREAVTQSGTFRFESRNDSGETILNLKLLFR